MLSQTDEYRDPDDEQRYGELDLYEAEVAPARIQTIQLHIKELLRCVIRRIVDKFSLVGRRLCRICGYVWSEVNQIGQVLKVLEVRIVRRQIGENG